MFHNTGANAFAKNQMRLAYEDKRDLYCIVGRRGLECDLERDADYISFDFSN